MMSKATTKKGKGRSSNGCWSFTIARLAISSKAESVARVVNTLHFLASDMGRIGTWQLRVRLTLGSTIGVSDPRGVPSRYLAPGVSRLESLISLGLG